MLSCLHVVMLHIVVTGDVLVYACGDVTGDNTRPVLECLPVVMLQVVVPGDALVFTCSYVTGDGARRCWSVDQVW